MASNEPVLMVVSLWRYIKGLLLGHTTSNTADSYPQEIDSGLRHKVLIPEKLISNLEYLYKHGTFTDDKLERYEADVNYFLQILDDYSGDDLGQFISEINELDALINLARGNNEQAQADLSYALSLNPAGTWLVSNTAQNWNDNAEKKSVSPKPVKSSIDKTRKSSPEFHNTWNENIGGWGYSENSKFNRVRKEVFKRDKYKCSWCESRIELTVDHIIERHLGGTNELSNLRTLCKDCHEKRHARKIFDRDFDVDDEYGFSKSGNAKILSLIQAADNGKGISIEYQDRDKLRSIRVIHPVRIYKAKYIFVNAYCELDKEERVFRLSRMKPTSKNDNMYINKSNSYTSSVWAGNNFFNSNAGQTIYARPTNQNKSN